MSGRWQTIEQAAVSLQLSVRTINRHLASGKLNSRLKDGRREIFVDSNASIPAMQEAPSSRMDDLESDNEALKSAVRDAFRKLNNPAADAPAAHSGIPEVHPEIEPADLPRPAEPAARRETVEPEVHHVDVDTAKTTSFQEGASELNTVLALVDRASDKAELAVAAYQALARAADARVASSRRSARFAWGLVGACVLVAAVGGTMLVRSNTNAQIDQHVTHQQLTEAQKRIQDLEDKRQAIESERDAARLANARIEGKLESTQSQLKSVQDEQRQEQPDRPTLFDRITSIWMGE